MWWTGKTYTLWHGCAPSIAITENNVEVPLIGQSLHFLIYIFKWNYMSVVKKYLYFHVHCSIISKSQISLNVHWRINSKKVWYVHTGNWILFCHKDRILTIIEKLIKLNIIMLSERRQMHKYMFSFVNVRNCHSENGKTTTQN